MKYPVTDIFTYSPFMPNDYLCAEQDGSGMDTGGGTDSADGGFVDNGTFDLGSNPDAVMGQDTPSFSNTAVAVGTAVGVVGGYLESPGVIAAGAVIAASPDIAAATQQGFGALVDNASIMGGPMATQTDGFTDTSQNTGNGGFGGGTDSQDMAWFYSTNAMGQGG